MRELGTKYDVGKPQISLVVPELLTGVAEVLTFGANKYGAYNWAGGLRYSRVFSALMRHLWAWWGGEELDKETGLSHLSHAACNIMFLIYMGTHGKYKSFDDRFAGNTGSEDKENSE